MKIYYIRLSAYVTIKFAANSKYNIYYLQQSVLIPSLEQVKKSMFFFILLVETHSYICIFLMLFFHSCIIPTFLRLTIGVKIF
jgi:hypothetical protein